MDTQRRTKIVATMGPATDDPRVVADMVHAGLDVARINFSHGTRDSQRKRVELGRAAGRRKREGPQLRDKRIRRSLERRLKDAGCDRHIGCE